LRGAAVDLSRPSHVFPCRLVAVDPLDAEKVEHGGDVLQLAFDRTFRPANRRHE
jgi:hypothetical protein